MAAAPLSRAIGRGVFIPERRSSASFTPRPPEQAAGNCNRTVRGLLLPDPRSSEMTGWSGEPHRNPAVELVTSMSWRGRTKRLTVVRDARSGRPLCGTHAVATPLRTCRLRRVGRSNRGRVSATQFGSRGGARLRWPSPTHEHRPLMSIVCSSKSKRNICTRIYRLVIAG